MNYPATFELPTTDTLTGLVTGPYLRHLLGEELLPQAKKSGEPLTLFLLDIDGFLEANNTHGRELADQVLRSVAGIIRDRVGEKGIPARYGGDEFAVALPGTRLDDAFTLAEEIRREVAALPFERQPDLQLTCSIGLASYPAHGQRDVELMREADGALYVAKNTGRNKVALPLADSRMITKTSHYTSVQLERLAQLARTLGRNEASLLREALDDLLKKHNDRQEALNTPA